MIKAPNGQNKLVNKIFSVEGLILVIVLTALGLSIAAFAIPCKSPFGVVGEKCMNPNAKRGDPDYGYCKTSDGSKVAVNEWCKPPSGECKADGDEGPGLGGTCTDACVDDYGIQFDRPNTPICKTVGNYTDFPNRSVPKSGDTEKCDRRKTSKTEKFPNCCGGDKTACMGYGCGVFGPTPPPFSDDNCYYHNDSPKDCCETNGCAWYGRGGNTGYCANGPDQRGGTNCCSNEKYTPGIDYAACKYPGSGPYIPIPPSSPPHKTGGFRGKTGGFGPGGTLNSTSPPGSPSRPPTSPSGSPSPPPTSPPGSPSGSSHDNSHLGLIITLSVVGGLLLIGGGVTLARQGKM